MRSRRAFVLPIVFMVVAAVGAVAASVGTGSTPTLGLDLQGGFSVVLQAREVDGQLPAEESVEQAKDLIRERVDSLGVAEPDIVRQGRTVIVQLPGVTDREQAERVVGCTAKLEFRPVIAQTFNPDLAPDVELPEDSPDGADPTTTTEVTGETTEPAGDTTTTAPGGDGEGETGAGAAGISSGEGALGGQFAPTTTTTTLPPTTTTEPAPETTTTTAVPEDTTTTTVPTDTEAAGPAGSAGCESGIELSDDALALATPAPEGGIVAPSEDATSIYTLGPVGFTGDALSSADAALQEGWAINVSVRDSERATANAAFNACFAGEAGCPPQGQAGRGAIAIVLDGQVISAPAVNGPDLASDQFTISGSSNDPFTESEAKELALLLRLGSLPVEFEQVALQQVSATLGNDSLRAGMIAGVIGLVAVALYMVAYYRLLGLVVVAGLGIWSALMYGVVTWLSATQGLALTLSGIIGMIISVGTTVDSYIVYFERLRDEVRDGRSMRNSSERGFKSAYRTIFAAAITSFLGAFLLWWLTVGPVRGFAFFLGISVLLSLVVTYFFTRPVVVLLSRSERFAPALLVGVSTPSKPIVSTEGAAS